MNRSIKLWQLIGFVLTSLGGTLLHFLYDLFNKSMWIAPFSSVNESTWEHMKLLFWPMFIFAIVQYFFFKDEEKFWCVKLKGILLGLILIPILFYTLNGSIGKLPSYLNIAIFFISVSSSYLYETRKFNNETTYCKNANNAFFILCVIAILFVVFSFKTPKIGIFKDPLNGTYGIYE